MELRVVMLIPRWQRSHLTVFPYLVSKSVNLTRTRRNPPPHTVDAAATLSDSGSLLQSGAEVETVVHAGEHVQHALGMFRYFLKRAGKKKEKKRSHPLWLQQAGAKGLASIYRQQTGTHTLAGLQGTLATRSDVAHTAFTLLTILEKRLLRV